MKIELNTLYNLDYKKGIKFIGDKTINLVVTDPPYLHDKGGNGGGNTRLATSKMYSKDSPMIEEMSNFTKEECIDMLNEVKRVMIKMNAYFFCNDSLIPFYTQWAIENKYKYSVLTWNKPLSILNRERYSTNMEYIIRIYEKGTALNKLDLNKYPNKKEYYSKYRYFKQLRGRKTKVHPLQKPIELIDGYIELSSNENDTVLDLFAGSGTTLVSAKKLKRNYIGFEINQEHYNNGLQRLLKTDIGD